MRAVAVIMAGGKGERFWPLSREARPKQFLELTGQNSMIQSSVARIGPLIPPGDTFIVTGESYLPLVKQHLPDIPAQNIIAEPEGRNTAPCVGLAAVTIKHRLKAQGAPDDAVMVMLPADHHILNPGEFRKTLQAAIDLACDKHGLVTIGITPTRPETGYGYIEYEDAVEKTYNGLQAHKVKRFTEKPDAQTALRFISSGKYLWNSGIFVWQISSIRDEIQKHAPDIHAGLERIEVALGTQGEDEAIRSEFAKFPSISIDYAVMEKSDKVYVIPGNFGWDDIGTWSALARLYEGDANQNVVVAPWTPGQKADEIPTSQAIPLAFVDSRNCVVYHTGRLVAAIGVEDLIIVETGDAVLICKKQKEQKLKELIAQLRARGLNSYL